MGKYEVLRLETLDLETLKLCRQLIIAGKNSNPNFSGFFINGIQLLWEY